MACRIDLNVLTNDAAGLWDEVSGVDLNVVDILLFKFIGVLVCSLDDY